MEVKVTFTLRELRELHDLAFYARQMAKDDGSKEGEKMETLAAIWDDRFHNTLSKD